MEPSKEDSDRPPEYHALDQSPSPAASSFFIDHRRAQEERIHRLLALYVDPLLKSHASSGIAKAIFVLVPSDSTTLQSENASQADVIDKREYSGFQDEARGKEVLTSFADNENVRLVRLHGEQNTWAFWSQPSVVRELELAVRARYNLPVPQPKEVAQELPRTETPPGKRRLFGRKSSNKPNSSGMFSSGGGWSLVDQQPKPEWGQVALEIKVEEVSLRSETSMGMLDTRSGHALVLRIHIGS